MAATTIDTLQVEIQALTKGFNKKIKEVQGDIDSLAGAGKKADSKLSASFNKIGKIANTALKVGVAGSIAAITASIPSAVRRVDTLKNASRTFENMGIDAKDAERAMGALNDSIKGLPTPLDSAVRGMTALTATYGDIDKGQKIFSALNNAILGFGGSAAEVDNAIQQLSQLPMDGPLDAQTWNSLRNSGLTPVLVAMSKEFGMSVSEMKESLGSGQLKVKDFTDKLIEMNEKGGGGMKSLAKIAKDSTDGIGTGWQNMQTAIARGVGKIIEAVGSSGIASALAGIGEAFEKGLTGVANGVKRVQGFISDLSKMNPEEAAKSIGKALGDALKKAFEGINIGFSAVRKFVDKIDWFGVGRLIVVKIIPGLIGGLLAGIGSDDLWVSLWQTVSKNWGEILMGVLAIALAPSKVLGPLTKIIGKIPIIGPLTNWLVNGIRSLFAPIRGAFGSIFTAAFDDVGIRVLLFIDKLKVFFGTILNILLAPFRMFVDDVAVQVYRVPGFFSGMMNLVKTAITTSLNVVKTIFVNIFTGIFNVVKTIFAPFVEFFKGLFTALGKHLSGVPKLFTSPFSTAWNGVKTIWNAAKGYFTGIWNAIKGVLSGVGGWFKNTFSGAYNNVTSIFSRLHSFFSGVWDKIVSVFRGAGTRVGDAVGGTFKSVVNSVLNRVASIINGFIGTINGAVGAINKIPGVNVGKINNISVPHLAAGGIVTAPTLAMIGEGGQSEAVIPLDKLDKMVGPTQIIVKIGEETIIDRVVEGINGQSFMNNAAVINV